MLKNFRSDFNKIVNEGKNNKGRFKEYIPLCTALGLSAFISCSATAYMNNHNVIADVLKDNPYGIGSLEDLKELQAINNGVKLEGNAIINANGLETTSEELEKNILCKKVEVSVLDPVAYYKATGTILKGSAIDGYTLIGTKLVKSESYYAPAVVKKDADGDTYYEAPAGYAFHDDMTGEVICKREEVVSNTMPDPACEEFRPMLTAGYNFVGDGTLTVYATAIKKYDEYGRVYYVTPVGFEFDQEQLSDDEKMPIGKKVVTLTVEPTVKNVYTTEKTYSLPSGYILDGDKGYKTETIYELDENQALDGNQEVHKKTITEEVEPTVNNVVRKESIYSLPEGYVLQDGIGYKEVVVYATPIQNIDADGNVYYTLPEGFILESTPARQRVR